MPKSPTFDRRKPRTIVYGVFKGMGDLLCAAPTIVAVLSDVEEMVLVVFPQLREAVDLIEFGPQRHKLKLAILPAAHGPTVRDFLKDISRYSTDLIWISPHAPMGATTWKTPFLMWALKRLYWTRAVLAGEKSERLSWLFDTRVTVDRRAPFMVKEWQAFSALQLSAPAPLPEAIGLIESIASIRSQTAKYDLIIHPGAAAENRKWPWPFYRDVVARIPAGQRIAVVGLPDDVDALRAVLPADRSIEFLTGTLTESVKAIARSRVALTMDSGSMFFANALRVPTVSLFGTSNPATVVAPGSSVTPVFEVNCPCQPCGKPTCSQSSLICLSSINPQKVADLLLGLLNR